MSLIFLQDTNVNVRTNVEAMEPPGETESGADAEVSAAGDGAAAKENGESHTDQPQQDDGEVPPPDLDLGEEMKEGMFI